MRLLRMILGLFSSKKQKVNKDGIALFGIFYPAPQKFTELSNKQQQLLRVVQFNNLQGIAYSLVILSVLLDVYNKPLLRYIFAWYVRAEEKYAMLPLTNWVFQSDVIWGFGTEYRMREKMSLLQFIRLDSAIRELAQADVESYWQIVHKIVSIAFLPIGKKYNDTDVDRRTEFIGKLNMHLLIDKHTKAVRAYNEVINSWPKIFPQKSQAKKESAVQSQELEWFKIMRLLAQHPTEMERMADMDTDAVFFELTERMEEKSRLEQKLQQ
jgi:hypothetical protein